MKMLSVGLLFLVSNTSWATLLVPAYNENYCPSIDHIVPVIRASAGDKHLSETFRLMSIVSQWNSAFMAAGDTVIANNSLPLCVGLMDDGGKPNAAAVGDQFLLMGVSLIAMLENQNGAGLQAKEVKEKFVLAHEYAHIIQNLHKLRFDYTLPMLSTKIKEQHADCMAAYMIELNNEIPFTLLDDLAGFIQQLADTHIVGDHGTSEQRIAAFQNGSNRAIFHKMFFGKVLSATTSSDLVRECAFYYKPTNLN